jgi:hypothetical protein
MEILATVMVMTTGMMIIAMIVLKIHFSPR